MKNKALILLKSLAGLLALVASVLLLVNAIGEWELAKDCGEAQLTADCWNAIIAGLLTFALAGFVFFVGLGLLLQHDKVTNKWHYELALFGFAAIGFVSTFLDMAIGGNWGSSLAWSRLIISGGAIALVVLAVLLKKTNGLFNLFDLFAATLVVSYLCTSINAVAMTNVLIALELVPFSAIMVSFLLRYIGFVEEPAPEVKEEKPVEEAPAEEEKPAEAE